MKIDLDFGDHLELTPGMKLRLRLPPLTDEQLMEISSRNDFWRFEREANGELSVEAAKGMADGLRITELNYQLGTWNRTGGDEKGLSCGSNAGFTLPNGALRSPIASWVSQEQWRSLRWEDRQGFAKVCPSFVAEMRTLNLRLDELDGKMREYQKCGVRLGLLFDPEERMIYCYRPGADVEILNNPAHVSCEPEMSGFVVETVDIFRKHWFPDEGDRLL